MKNNFLNKTAGTIIIAGMLCAMLTAGCANTNSNTEVKDSESQQATISTNEEELKTLTVPTEYINSDRGITIEGTNSKYENLYVETPKDYYDPCEIADKSIKEIFNIMICKPNDDRITKLDETVRVSIPYEKGLYIAHSIGDIVYDIDAEYTNGKYVFETNRIGKFIVRTEPVGRKSPEKTTELKLENQTIVDELTGIQVSGEIPVGAVMDASVTLIDSESFGDRFDTPYSVESDYPEFTDITDYLIEYEYEKKVDNIAKLISEKNWNDYEGSLGGKIVVRINFVKDYEILDFESDLTVTLPYNYRRGLVIGGITDGAKVVQYDYDARDFVELELVPEEDTPKGRFQFKTKNYGTFFVGGKSHIDNLVWDYKNH